MGQNSAFIERISVEGSNYVWQVQCPAKLINSAPAQPVTIQLTGEQILAIFDGLKWLLAEL